MLKILLLSFFSASAAVQFDGSSKSAEVMGWVCIAKGEESTLKQTEVQSKVKFSEIKAKEDAYYSCRQMGLDRCEIASCLEIPNQF
jgi:hypothetical protein